MFKYLILILLYQDVSTNVGFFERHPGQIMGLRNGFTQEQLNQIRNYPKYSVQLMPYQIVNGAVRTISYVPQIFNYLVPYKTSDLFANAKYKEICTDFRDSLEEMDRKFYLVCIYVIP